ncbi:MAG TPA: hypothetical protein VF746_26715 [Longimicrobium sp.]
MFKTLRNRFSLLAVAGAAMLFAGCEDLGISTGTGEFQVVVTGATGGTLATVSTGGLVSGSLTVPAGGSRQITVTVLDRGGGPVTIGAGDRVRVIVTNTVVASFTVTGEAGSAVTGVLHGGSSGSTSLSVQLLRGGVAEFNSASIPITVG